MADEAVSTDYMAPDTTVDVSAPKEDRKAPAEIDRVEIKKADNGGFVVTCFKKGGGRRAMPSEPETYAAASRGDLNGILDEKFGAEAAPAEEPEMVDVASVAGTVPPSAPPMGGPPSEAV